ncbi:amidase, partial [Tremellales sp. Uapishka_1]
MPIKTPVTSAEVLAASKRLNFEIPSGHEDEYLALLAMTDKHCEIVLSQNDYKPEPDLIKYPRSNIHLPKPGPDNPLGAWAWKAEAGDSVHSTGKMLSGKTVVFKDTVCMAGVPLLFGTDAFTDYIPDVDATVVTRVLENGGSILGKAACENFSHGATSSSSPYGPVENPYAPGFTTGGSSSGCGGLIGSGAVDMGIGGDQGGSIRIPASFCGIVGLKPTFGLVPYTGVLSSDSGIDHIGPMARTVLETAMLLEATAGYDNIDDRQLGAPLPGNIPEYVHIVERGRAKGITGMRVGVLKEAFENKDLAPAVEQLLKGAIDRFAALGAVVEEVSVPTEYGWVKWPTAYGKAMNLARRMRDEMDAIFERFDIIVMPTCPQPPRRHIPAGSGPLGWAKHAPGTSSITAAANLSGHPSMSIPVGFAPPMAEDIRGPEDASILLPVGMMITAKYWEEATILRAGDAWEQSVDWKTLRPLISA